MRERLTPKERALYDVIRKYGPRFAASLHDLAALARCAINTVRKFIQYLIEWGCLKREKGSSWRASRYELLRELEPDLISQEVAALLSNLPPPTSTDTQIATRNSLDQCPNCGHSLQLVPRASVNNDEARARLTTDRHSSETENNEQVSQSVLEWVAERCGQIKSFFTRRELEVQVQRIGKSQEELIIRFFESKWPEVQERYAKGILRYVHPGLFTAMLREGEFRAWKNLNAPQLAREARWKEQLAEAEDFRKGMETADAGIEEATRNQLRAMGVHA